MANTPGGSFIPKRSTGKTTPRRSGRRIYIFSYVAYIIFFGTLLSVVGIFFLNQQTERQLQEHVVLLETERQSFNTSQLGEIKALDSRLRIARTILDRHTAPSLIFEALEEVVVGAIQFTSFTYTKTGTESSVILGGVTESFDALLFQQEVLKENPILAAADVVQVTVGGGVNIVEGANRDAGQSVLDPSAGRLTFTFENNDLAAHINYRDRLGQVDQNEPVPASVPAPVATTSASETVSPANQTQP